MMQKKKNIAINTILKCPVCLDKYGGRIFQCINGHDVCEGCRKNLGNCCPQCRKEFTGTRNFSLEQLISALAKQETEEKSEKENVETSVAPKKHKVGIFDGPHQGKGLFKCRIPDCKSNLPICRTLNHIRSNHKALLYEIDKNQILGNKTDYTVVFTNPCTSHTRAYQLPKLGLFFLVTEFVKKQEITTFYSWLSIVAPNEIAKTFTYSIELEVMGAVAYFSDAPHSTRRTPEMIRSQYECLNLSTTDNRLKEYTLTLKIKPNRGSKKHNRRTVVKKKAEGIVFKTSK